MCEVFVVGILVMQGCLNDLMFDLFDLQVMGNENINFEIILDGDVLLFWVKMCEVILDFKNFGEIGEKQFGWLMGLFVVLQEKFLVVGVVFVGGVVFKEVVEIMVRYNEEVEKFVRVLGEFVLSVSVLCEVLEQGNISQEEFFVVSNGFMK